MSAIASQITSHTLVYSNVCSGANQRKHHSSASLAFVRGIHRWPVNSPYKWQATRKMFPFDDVIMICSKSNYNDCYTLVFSLNPKKLRTSYVITLDNNSTCDEALKNDAEISGDQQLRTLHISWKFQCRLSMHCKVVPRMFIMHCA